MNENLNLPFHSFLMNYLKQSGSIPTLEQQQKHKKITNKINMTNQEYDVHGNMACYTIIFGRRISSKKKKRSKKKENLWHLRL
jgi:hypothetical protein